MMSDCTAKWFPGEVCDHLYPDCRNLRRPARPHASAILFIRGRLHFHYVDGRRAPANSGAPSVLVAYGRSDADAIRAAPIAGYYVEVQA